MNFKKLLLLLTPSYGLIPGIPPTLTHDIVHYTSTYLSQVDSVGHHVLKHNADMISFVLENDKIPDEIKKKIILESIKIAQMGDNMGSHILESYYNLVNALL
jgi:hypothetical protein